MDEVKNQLNWNGESENLFNKYHHHYHSLLLSFLILYINKLYKI